MNSAVAARSPKTEADADADPDNETGEVDMDIASDDDGDTTKRNRKILSEPRPSDDNKARQVTMRPLHETDDQFSFTLAGLDVSLANALRRVVADHIPSYVFDIASCKIEVNTSSKLHDEILKERLRCIPIHKKVDVEALLEKQPGYNLFENYVMELNVQNNTENYIYVTTGDFRVKNKTTARYLTDNELHQIFPKHPITNGHIIFTRLRPKISDAIPGEHIKLTCGFAIAAAEENGAYAAACCSTYGNTVDDAAAHDAWEKLQARYRQDGVDAEEIAFRKKNFDVLDRQRYFVDQSFDFRVESVGVYTPREMCRIACLLLKTHFDELGRDIEADVVTVVNSKTTMKAFDFVLEKGDFTIGKVLEYLLYANAFDVPKSQQIVQFCGFRRFHPHDAHTVLRVSYVDAQYDKTFLKRHLNLLCAEASAFYAALQLKF
jgi:DNA-directed RNA polymerase subunit L